MFILGGNGSGIWYGRRGTALEWAFREEERMADMAVAKAAGSLVCFLRSRSQYGIDRWEYSSI